MTAFAGVNPRRATGCCSAQPALTASSARSGGKHGVRAVVRAGAQGGELTPDQERLLRPGGQGVIKPAGPGPQGDAALALPHSRPGEHPRGQPAPWSPWAAGPAGCAGWSAWRWIGGRFERAGHTDTVGAGPAVHGLSTGDPLARRRCRTSCSDGYVRLRAPRRREQADRLPDAAR